MSYGNCCLVSDIPENTEVTGKYADTFRKGDTQSLKERLEYLLAHPEAVNQMKEHSSDYICSRYNWDEVVEKTLQLYRR